ncbi:5112_t:CDS:2 [Dentiscutata erythropus]|uniref:5112_t:CDS:1 n=1 Tax=Dentiscutata erythropus TaxID=1348616 RepID=A0A9N8ZGC3_9GLOM|nr:5112_t:CDS:2 [Dentiscutata erythropus]
MTSNLPIYNFPIAIDISVDVIIIGILSFAMILYKRSKTKTNYISTPGLLRS